jgi:hypothetical protein
MNPIIFFRSDLKQVATFAIVGAFFVVNPALSSPLNTTELGNDENSFVFTGKCSNGETYRLTSYQKIIAGKHASFYDYEGPVGNGSVQTETAPKVMAQRVCRKYAEISSTSYWEQENSNPHLPTLR